MRSVLLDFWLQLSNWQLDSCLLLAMLLMVAHQLYHYLRYMAGVLWEQLNTRKQLHSNEAIPTLPTISVIVCARNERDNLRDYLHTLLNQDYPCFEVIVVDDGSEDQTTMILEQYARQYTNFYCTFVPREARVISSKKLALTIGAKAAHNECLVLTDADCRPESRYWLREMASGFTGGKTEVVLGFSAYFEKEGLLNGLICYDTLFTGLQYLGMARAGYPYMGVGRNLAYRRDTFFNNNGFQGLLGERAGDDDLFVNKVANKDNTSIVCSKESVVWSIPKTTWRDWLHQKRRHLSVSPHYNINSKLRLVVEPMTRGMMYLLLILLLAFGDGLMGCAALLLFVIRLIIQLLVINLSAKRLGLQRHGLEIICYDIALPIINLYMLCTQSFRKQPIYW